MKYRNDRFQKNLHLQLNFYKSICSQVAYIMFKKYIDFLEFYTKYGFIYIWLAHLENLKFSSNMSQSKCITDFKEIIKHKYVYSHKWCIHNFSKYY